MIERKRKMLNLSIMPLDVEHVSEICQDIVDQQKNGVSTHAMFMMKFNPEGTPAVNKAEIQCKQYDLFRKQLDKAGAKHGVLVQATLGHIVTPYEPYPFQPTVSLITGEDRVVTACPLDPELRKHLRAQMRILAEHKPAMVMIDDDVGVLYKPTKGCACKYHMAEFNRRAGTNMTRQELYAHTQGKTEEDRKYTDLYVEVQRDALVGCVEAMRAGLDEVDPTIQGAVSGIYTSAFLEFSDLTAKAFAGKGNPAIVRMNGGPYGKSSHRYFTDRMFRAAILKENAKEKVDIFLAETDTCPHNRYSTSAALLHSHFTASILEGAQGAKHWITRLPAYEPDSGKAYRKKLAEYAKFYEALCEYTKQLHPFGCKIPLTLEQNFGFVPSEMPQQVSPWSTCVLERFGLPLYFSNDGSGAIFLDEFAADKFDDVQVTEFLKRTLIRSALAAQKLCKRGFGEYIGVDAGDWNGEVISTEYIGDAKVGTQYGVKELKILQDGVEHLSEVVHIDGRDGSKKPLFPGVTRFENALGGEVIVFCGSPDMPFSYATAFSLLNETRKKQFVEILSKRGHLPVYYPGDVDVYLRAGTLDNGESLCAVFDTGFDALDELELVCQKPVAQIQKLNPDGTRCDCDFSQEGTLVRVSETVYPYTPLILFIS